MTAAADDAQVSRSGWDAGRVLMVVFGAIVTLIGAAILAGGGAIVWLDQTQRDSSGYLNTPTEHFVTRSFALVSDPFEVDLDNADSIARDSVVGRLRIQGESADSDEELFLGVARSTDVDRYLAGVDSDEVVDIGPGGSRPEYVHRPGGPPPTTPAAQPFWAASASGRGPQVVTWKAESGDWTIVAMNADGSPGVSARVRVGARLGLLEWLGPVLLVGGGLLLAAGVTMIVFGVRQRYAAAASSEGRPTP